MSDLSALSLADFFEDHRTSKHAAKLEHRKESDVRRFSENLNKPTGEQRQSSVVTKTAVPSGEAPVSDDAETQKVSEMIIQMEATLALSFSLAQNCMQQVGALGQNADQDKKEGSVAKQDKFMQSFDSVAERSQAIEFMNQFGFVCLHNVVDDAQCESLEDRCFEWLEGLGSGLKRGDWSTFTNAHMPDNYTTGLLDGVAPPDPKASGVSKEQLLYEKMLSLAKKSGQASASTASEPCDDFMAEESGTDEIQDILKTIDAAPIVPIRLSAGNVRSQVPHKRKRKDMRAVVQGDSTETSRYICREPIYYVARETPNASDVQAKKKRKIAKTTPSSSTSGNLTASTTILLSRSGSMLVPAEDELNVELNTVRDMRYRFDPLTHCQEAWNIRSSPRIYAFYRQLWNGEDDLLASVDRLLFQRPLLSRPRNTAENWSNFEQRPTWEQNPYWSSNPLLQHAIEQRRCSQNSESIGDGSHMLLQKRKRVHKSAKKPKSDGVGKLEAQQHTSFFTGYQSLLALRDIPADGGAFYLVPGFHKVYAAYASAHAKEWSKTASGVVRADSSDPLAKKLIFPNAMQVPLRRGTLLVFDKRLPRWGSDNRRVDEPTMAMYLNMWPREPAFDAAYRRIRALSVRYGIRCTALQHLTGHIATPPRWKRAVPRSVYKNYCAPLFTELGLCLTGVRQYNQEIVENATSLQQ